MLLHEMLIKDIKNAERKANEGGLLPPAEVKKAKYIKINPKILHELMEEQEIVLKSNKTLPPYITYIRLKNEPPKQQFFGIPLLMDQKAEKWEIVI